MRAPLALLLSLLATAAVAQTPQQRLGAQLRTEGNADRFYDSARAARQDPLEGSGRTAAIEDDRLTLRPDAGQVEELGLLPDGVRARGVDPNVTR